jgi:hypothetical protein
MTHNNHKNIVMVHPKLEDIANLDMFLKEPKERIPEIWEKYHERFHCVSATIPFGTYTLIQGRANACPKFVFPRS